MIRKFILFLILLTKVLFSAETIEIQLENDSTVFKVAHSNGSTFIQFKDNVVLFKGSSEEKSIIADHADINDFIIEDSCISIVYTKKLTNNVVYKRYSLIDMQMKDSINVVQMSSYLGDATFVEGGRLLIFGKDEYVIFDYVQNKQIVNKKYGKALMGMSRGSLDRISNCYYALVVSKTEGNLVAIINKDTIIYKEIEPTFKQNDIIDMQSYFIFYNKSLYIQDLYQGQKDKKTEVVIFDISNNFRRNEYVFGYFSYLINFDNNYTYYVCYLPKNKSKVMAVRNKE